MSDPAAAAEHLRLIRGMMERATVYRAISAPAAIFGGVLACATGGYFIVKAGGGAPVRGAQFYWTWVAVLVVVSVFNSLLLWRKSKQVGEALWSPGLRLACLSIAPALAAGGLLSFVTAIDYDQFEVSALVWILCYGAALLAMGGVAPRSIRRLGWMFIVAGILLCSLWRELWAAMAPSLQMGNVEAASLMMIATFGLLHLVHGAGVLLRRREGEELA